MTPAEARTVLALLRDQAHQDQLTEAGLVATVHRLQSLTNRPGFMPPDPILSGPLPSEFVVEARQLQGYLHAECLARQRLREGEHPS